MIFTDYFNQHTYHEQVKMVINICIHAHNNICADELLMPNPKNTIDMVMNTFINYYRYCEQTLPFDILENIPKFENNVNSHQNIYRILDILTDSPVFDICYNDRYNNTISYICNNIILMQYMITKYDKLNCEPINNKFISSILTMSNISAEKSKDILKELLSRRFPKTPIDLESINKTYTKKHMYEIITRYNNIITLGSTNDSI